jgi:XTP/dITP diphosphohydrolase
MGQPALSLAAKLVQRSGKAGVDVPLPPADGPDAGIGGKLLALVAEAVHAGIDPELALRSTAREYADAIRNQENIESPG